MCLRHVARNTDMSMPYGSTPTTHMMPNVLQPSFNVLPTAHPPNRHNLLALLADHSITYSRCSFSTHRLLGPLDACRSSLLQHGCWSLRRVGEMRLQEDKQEWCYSDLTSGATMSQTTLNPYANMLGEHLCWPLQAWPGGTNSSLTAFRQQHRRLVCVFVHKSHIGHSRSSAPCAELDLLAVQKHLRHC